MSVEASFIDSLLVTSGGSDGSGDADSNADSGAGQGAGLTEGESGGRESLRQDGAASDSRARVPSESSEDSSGGSQPGDKGQDSAAHTAAKPAATDAKPSADDPITQIGRLNGALRESRSEGKELKAQLAAQAAQLATMQEQLKALANPPKPAEVEEEPDFLTDPKVYVDKNLAKAKQEADRAAAAVKKLEDGETTRAEQAKKQEEMQQQWSEVLSKEAEFTAETPDYQQALGYVRNLRVQAFTAEYEAINDRAPTPAEISKALTTQEIQGALTLQSKGKNPAQWYYNYAQQLGYKPVEAAPAVEPAAVLTPPAAKVPAPKPDKDAVRGMGSGGGADTTPDPEAASKDPMASLLGAVHGEMTQKRKARRA